MCRPATDGEHLATLVREAVDLCRAAHEQLPARAGPGRPPDFARWQLAVLILIAIARRRKTKSSQHAFLVGHGDLLLSAGPLRAALGLDKLPCRSTFMARYADAHAVYERAIELQGRRALARHASSARVVAVDKSIVAARGPAYHRRLQRAVAAGRRPRPAGVDPEAAWGYGPHDGWVWGYSYEVVVCATKNHVVFPLLASVGTASCNEHTSFRAKVPRLPASVRYVLADGGYDGNDIAEAVEHRPRPRPRPRRVGGRRPRGRPPGPRRRFLCPLQARCGKPAVGRVVHRGARERRRQHRAARARFYHSVRGKRLYRQRSRTVEPFNQWFKHLFDLEDRVWHRGLGNNRTMFLAAIFAYQLLLRHSIKSGRRDGCIQWLMDAL